MIGDQSGLKIIDLVKAYQRDKPVLKGISLAIGGQANQSAGLTAIIGPSGTGKSTLIRCINRLVEPTSGRIELNGQPLTGIKGLRLRHARRAIGMVFQEYNLVERLTVMENLLTGRLGYTNAWSAWRRKFAPADIDRAFALLEVVGLADFVHRRADALSGGQRQRVGIARALMQEPSMLLADEPTSSLDPKTSVEIMTLLRDQGIANNIPVLINMHDVELARRFADRIIGMSGGRVVFDGVSAQLGQPQLDQIYG